MQYTTLSIDRLAVLALFATCFSSLSLAAPTVEKLALEKRACGPILMGLCKSFGALSATTLTSIGATAITGNGGVYPGSSISGFPPATCSGTLGGGTVLAQNGKAACQTAYNNALACPVTSALVSANLGGLTLLPGVYTFPASAASFSATLTLNAAGNSKAQFIFKITTTFTVAAAAKMVLINGAQPCNVYFLVGSSASIGAGALLQGNMIAYTSIAVGNGATNKGTWNALNGGVTLINNTLIAQSGSCPT